MLNENVCSIEKYILCTDYDQILIIKSGTKFTMLRHVCSYSMS